MRKIIIFVLLILSILFYFSWTVKSDLDEPKKDELVTYYESWYAIINTGTVVSYEQKEVEINVPKKKVVAQKKSIPKNKAVKQNVIQENTLFTWEQNQWVEYWKLRIMHYCWVHWLSESQCNTAIRIANAESWFNPYAKYWYWSNPNKVNEHICVKLKDGRCSTAAGLFQFTSSTRKWSSQRYWFAWYSKYDWDANISVALQKMKNEWFSARNASAHNW